MAKLLRPLTLVLLILSVVSLVLGINLFTKREIYKGRAEKFESSVRKIAGNIRYEEKIPAEVLQDYKRMDAPLNGLEVAAANQYTELQDTKQDLDIVTQDLNQTREELTTETAAKEAAQTQVEDLSQEVQQQEAEIAQTRADLTEAQQDKALCAEEKETISDQLVEAEDQITDLEARNSSLEQNLAELEAEQVGSAGTPVVPKLSGKILLVNPNWNYVVLDIGRKAGLVPNAELLVHRGDNLIGKVRVSNVKENLSVAEIVMDWELKRVREGDHVVN